VAADRIDMVVIGVPRRHDASTSEIIERCLLFIAQVREQLDVDVIETDEAFSTQRAHELMRSSGMSKKRRQQKGVKDQFAAAVILRDFLQEHTL
jgi:putative Holliday junction resolvase